MQKIIGLEGFRGVAAFWVFTHHFLLIFHPEFYFSEHGWANYFLNPDLAVACFFVHSGFVLSRKSLLSQDKKVYFKNLYQQIIKRYFRLLGPVLISVIFAYLLFASGMLYGPEYGQEINSRWLKPYFNFAPSLTEALYQGFYGSFFDFKSSTTYNSSLWTISYEIISSYLLYFILIMIGLIPHPKAKYLLIPLAFLIGPFKGLMAFLLGASLNLIPRLKPHWGLKVIIFLLALRISDLNLESATWFRYIGATLIMWLLLESPKIRDILGNKFFDWLGKISFSLYVLHFPLLVSLTCYLAKEKIISPIGNYFITTLTLFFISHLVTRWVDQKGILYSNKFSERVVRLLSFRKREQTPENQSYSENN